MENEATALNIPAITLPDGATAKPRISHDVIALAGMCDQYLAQAQAIEVVDAETHAAATAKFKVYSVASKQLETWRKEHREPYRKLADAVQSYFVPLANKLTEAKAIAGEKFAAWEDEQERLRQDAEREQRRIQAAEADRIAREQREIREAAEQIERKARQEAERLAEAGRLQEAAVVQQFAADDAAQKRDEAVDVALAAQVQDAPVVGGFEAPRAAGVQRRYSYSAEVLNLRELVQAWLDGKAPAGAIAADESFLNATARRDKDNFRVPGCVMRKVSKSVG